MRPAVLLKPLSKRQAVRLLKQQTPAASTMKQVLVHIVKSVQIRKVKRHHHRMCLQSQSVSRRSKRAHHLRKKYRAAPPLLVVYLIQNHLVHHQHPVHPAVLQVHQKHIQPLLNLVLPAARVQNLRQALQVVKKQRKKIRAILIWQSKIQLSKDHQIQRISMKQS